jgi:hypothetical protein
VRKISSHNAQLPEVSQKLPHKRIGVNVRLRFGADSLEFCVQPSAAYQPPLRDIPIAAEFPPLTAAFAVTPEAAKTRRPFTQIAEAYLTPPEDSRFEAPGFPAAGEFENASGLPDDGIYINPTVLKAARRDVYARIEEHYCAAREAKTALILAEDSREKTADAEHRPFAPAESRQAKDLPRRDTLFDSNGGISFVTDPGSLKPEDLFADAAGRLYLPLAPVLLHDAQGYFDGVKEFVLRCLDEKPERRFVLGLCNAGHIQFAQIFAEENRVEFFIDYGLYCANHWTVNFLVRLVPRLAFYYPWIEQKAVLGGNLDALHPGGLIPAAEYGDFAPPLFIGRGTRKNGNTDEPVELSANATSKGRKEFIVRSVRVAGAWLEVTAER